MDRITVIIVFGLLFNISITLPVYAQTEVEGEVSGEWTVEDSPYIATDDISVAAGQELIIQPGVEVQFEEHVRFLVYGLLTAVGTEEDSIWFITNDPENDIRWEGIHIIETEDGCEIAFSHISGIGWEGAFATINGILVSSSSAIIRNSLITDCFDFHRDFRYGRACLWVVDAIDVILENNTITGNTGSAVGCFGSGGITRITGNLIRDNIGTGIDCDQVNTVFILNNQIIENSLLGMELRASSEHSIIVIENNIISGNGEEGILSASRKTIIKDNLISNNGETGLHLNSNNGRTIVTGNIITGHARNGVYIQRARKGHFYNNVVYGNDHNGISIHINTHTTIQNCIIWGNGRDLTGPTDNIGFSTVESEFGEDGYINEEPRFVDPENGDFRLAEDSQLIDAGNPFPLYNDADGSRADLGAYGGNDLLFGFGESIEFQEVGYYCHIEDYFALFNFNENAITLRDQNLDDHDNFTFELEVPLQIPTLEWLDLPITFHPMEAGDYDATITLDFEDYEPVERAAIALNGTAIDGVIGEVQGVWTREMSPIHVIGDVRITNGDTLIIEPGVEVNLDPEVRFYTRNREGTILAIGTPEDFIRFTSSQEEPEPGDWRELTMMGRLSYCIVEYGGYVALRSSEFLPINSRIDNSTIRNMAGTGVHLDRASTLENSTIINCTRAISTSNGGSAYHNLFAFNEAVNVAAEWWWEEEDPYLITCEGNIFYQNGVINTFNRQHPDFRFNCIFESNVEGEPLIGRLNQENINGTACDENFNISIDPQFVDVEDLDFNLQEDSPCIDAGNPFWQRDIDGSWADIGPYSTENDDEDPNMIVDTESIEAEGSSEHVINIENNGNGRLWWRISAEEEWISIIPSNGVLRLGGDLDVFIHLSSENLENGIYETVLEIDSNDPENPNFGIDISMSVGGEDVREMDTNIPTDYYLSAAYPNPFNNRTTLRYGLPNAGQVEINIYDISGRHVKELGSFEKVAGNHTIEINAADMSSGLFIVRINVNGYSSVRKVVLLR